MLIGKIAADGIQKIMPFGGQDSGTVGAAADKFAHQKIAEADRDDHQQHVLDDDLSGLATTVHGLILSQLGGQRIGGLDDGFPILNGDFQSFHQ